MRPVHYDIATESPWRVARLRFAGHRAAVQGLALLMAVVIGDALAPQLRATLGDEPIARALQAGHTTLAFAVAAALAAVLAGGLWGGIAAALGGPMGRWLMRVAGGLAALPLSLLPVVAVGLGNGDPLLYPLLFDGTVVAALVPAAALSVHGVALEARRKEFLTAAEAAGLERRALFRSHTLPNAVGPLLAGLWPALPRAVAVLNFAAFLGMGGAGTWGALIAGALAGTGGWAVLLPPAILLAATLWALHAVGGGIAAAFGERR